VLQCNRVGIGRSHRSKVSHSCTSQRRARAVRRPRLPPMNSTSSSGASRGTAGDDGQGSFRNTGPRESLLPSRTVSEWLQPAPRVFAGLRSNTRACEHAEGAHVAPHDVREIVARATSSLGRKRASDRFCVCALPVVDGLGSVRLGRRPRPSTHRRPSLGRDRGGSCLALLDRLVYLGDDLASRDCFGTAGDRRRRCEGSGSRDVIPLSQRPVWAATRCRSPNRRRGDGATSAQPCRCPAILTLC